VVVINILSLYQVDVTELRDCLALCPGT